MSYRFNPITSQLDLVNDPGISFVTGQAWTVNVLLSPDGVTAVFTTPDTFLAGSLKVYLNGMRQIPGLSYDYTETTTNSFTFNEVPYATDRILVDYCTVSTGPTTSSLYGTAKYDTTGRYV